LSEDAAAKRWDLDFVRLQREQRQSNTLDGQDAGLVSQLQQGLELLQCNFDVMMTS
jgi:hypothetical protein